jgi:hypothetical protein
MAFIEFFDAEFAVAALAALSIPLVIAVSAALMSGHVGAREPRGNGGPWFARRPIRGSSLRIRRPRALPSRPPVK